MDDDPEVIRLLHAICSGAATAAVGTLPPLPVLLALAQLCGRSGHIDLCKAQLTIWVKRWIIPSRQHLTADILELAIICDDLQVILESCRALVMGSLSAEECHRADSLMEGVPYPSM